MEILLRAAEHVGKVADVAALGEDIKRCVCVFNKAYDLGLIEYQRVLDVMVVPFLKLAQKCQHSRGGLPSLRSQLPDMLFSSWVDGIIEAPLSFPDNNNSFKHFSISRPKRVEMLKTWISSKLPEVRSICQRRSLKAEPHPLMAFHNECIQFTKFHVCAFRAYKGQ